LGFEYQTPVGYTYIVSEREGTEMAIKAKYKIENQWNKGEIFSQEQEFESIQEIESFLAYNRAYIQEIQFVGKIKEGEE